MSKLYIFFALMVATSHASAAVTREDVLECELKNGGKFILHSKYDWSLTPFPAMHSSRETNRTGWNVIYRDQDGRESTVPTSVDYRGNTKLSEACSHFGFKSGVPLAPFTYLRADGSWAPQETMPIEKLDVARQFMPADSKILDDLDKAGIKSEAFRFGWIYANSGTLIFEKPLFRVDGGYAYSIPIDAVFQSFSSDGGITWSDGKVSANARIFELGRGRMEQSIRAKPLKLNGKKVF